MRALLATFQPHVCSGHAHSTSGELQAPNSRLQTSNSKRQARVQLEAVPLSASVDLPETTVFEGYAAKHERKSDLLIYLRSVFSAVSFLRLTPSEATGYPTIVNNIQPCPKRCLLMLLACVGARTGAPRLQLHNEHEGVANFRAHAFA